MINIISALIFSLSANIDNIALGIAYGIKKIHISFFSNFLIALCTSIITITSMQLGVFAFSFLDENIANLIGAISLILIGVFSIIKFVYTRYIKKMKAEEYNKTFKKLRIKELFLIILALSANNISVGVATSVAGIDMITALITTFLFSFLFMYIGNKLGKKLVNTFIITYSDILSSLLLICLGILHII